MSEYEAEELAAAARRWRKRARQFSRKTGEQPRLSVHCCPEASASSTPPGSCATHGAGFIAQGTLALQREVLRAHGLAGVIDPVRDARDGQATIVG